MPNTCPETDAQKRYHCFKLYGNDRLGGGWTIRFRNYADGFCELERYDDKGNKEEAGDLFENLNEDYVE